MATFNKKAKAETTLNHEGAKAYALSPEMELYILVVTSMFTDKFYEANDDRVSRLRALIVKTKPEFVAKLAIYAREKMYLRTMPLVLMVELAKVHSGDNLVSQALARVVQRADELTETLAYYAIANDRKDTKKLGKLSKQIKKGLAIAFNKFDEYQFGKYNRDGEITLKDALFIVHPTPANDQQAALFTKIVEDTLEIPFTWETELSAKGNKAEVWQGLVNSEKLPYMATLRNLRNMLDANVDQHDLATVAEMISDTYQVRKSKQLPFRYLSAYRELKGNTSPCTSMILDSLETAIQKSAENIKGFGFDTVVAIGCDVSGSMQTTISPKSKIQNYDIGLLLGMLLQSRCKSVVSGMFGDTFKIINLPKTSILQNVDELHHREGEVGYSTNGHEVLKTLEKKEIKADKVMMFTDNQMWNSYGTSDTMQKAWTSYKKFYPAAKLYLFDLAGYGTTPVSLVGSDVYLIAGWSDKVFDVMDAYDKGDSAIKHIDEISL